MEGEDSTIPPGFKKRISSIRTNGSIGTHRKDGTRGVQFIQLHCSAIQKNEMYAEPTLVFHEYFNKWITVYYNEIKNRMVLRSANEITGPWSEEQLIATGAEYPKPYGGFIYPLGLDKPEIFISLSQWDPLYNVFLMKVELKLK